MPEVLYGTSKIGPGGPGIVAKKVLLEDTDFLPAGVIVTGLEDPNVSTVIPDTFAFQATHLQKGAFQVNIARLDKNEAWKQDLQVSYLAWR